VSVRKNAAKNTKMIRLKGTTEITTKVDNIVQGESV